MVRPREAKDRSLENLKVSAAINHDIPIYRRAVKRYTKQRTNKFRFKRDTRPRKTAKRLGAVTVDILTKDETITSRAWSLRRTSCIMYIHVHIVRMWIVFICLFSSFLLFLFLFLFFVTLSLRSKRILFIVSMFYLIVDSSTVSAARTAGTAQVNWNWAVASNSKRHHQRPSLRQIIIAYSTKIWNAGYLSRLSFGKLRIASSR